MPRRWRKVGTGVEGLAVGGEKNAHWPAALPSQGLGGLHVDRIHIGPFLAINLDRNKVIIDHGRGLGVLEGLVCHHVTPVTRGVPDRKKDRHLPLGCGGKSLIRPRPPVHRVVGVLEQVRARRRSETVLASHRLGDRRQLGVPGWRSDSESSAWSVASSSGVRIFRNCLRMLKYRNTMAAARRSTTNRGVQPGLTMFGSTSSKIMLKLYSPRVRRFLRRDRPQEDSFPPGCAPAATPRLARPTCVLLVARRTMAHLDLSGSHAPAMPGHECGNNPHTRSALRFF